MKNGELPSSALAPVNGGGRLRTDAARAYNALDRYLKAKGLGSLSNAGDGATYRPVGHPGDYARGGPFTQYFAWERYQQGGNLAARVGTSNHGLGLACDFSGDAIDLVARYGSSFGWKKIEAFNEAWHYCYVPGNYAQVNAWAAVKAGDTIAPGDTGPGVVTMKQRLKVWGAWPRLWRIDQRYAGRTGAAVKAFQKARGLKADGIVGPGTWKVLNARPVVTPKKPIVKPKPPVKALPANARFFADLYAGDSTFDAHAYKVDGHTHIGLKASEGKTFADPAFVARWNESASLTRWAYHFARPSSNSPVDEAANFCRALDKVHASPADRLVLDWEDPNWSDSKDGSTWVQQFVDACGKYGHEIRVLYGGGPYCAGTVRKWPRSKSGPIRFWIAAYVDKPEAYLQNADQRKNLVACQYTDGQVGKLNPKTAAGIGSCDLSYFTGR
jgi:GH25 family lysozyme M1 (1,4-beta-N-acetylmuramidase)